MSATTTPTYLKPVDVAKRFAVPISRVNQWIQRGELPAMLVSVTTDSKRPQYRIRLQDVEEFERERTACPDNRTDGAKRRRRSTNYRRIV